MEYQELKERAMQVALQGQNPIWAQSSIAWLENAAKYNKAQYPDLSAYFMDMAQDLLQKMEVEPCPQ